MSESITFEAVIPSTVSAIRIHGDEGMRLTLDIDETNLPEALQIVCWRGGPIRVTIEPVGHTRAGHGAELD